MPLGIHRHAGRLLGVVIFVLIWAPGQLLAQQSWQQELASWESMQHQRTALSLRLEDLEAEHQKFVDAIENLKEERQRGEASRRELEEALRQNLQTVQSLERLQRQIQAIDAEQSALRRRIVNAIDAERENLESELAQAETSRRREIVALLNELQNQRRDFTAPLPAADQQRVAQVLQLARQVSDSHPRAMLSAADELADAEDYLLARLDRVSTQIRELEQAQRLSRRTRQFGEFGSFFEEDQRSRHIDVTVQSSQTGDEQNRGSEDRSDGAAEFENVEADAPDGMDDGTDETDPLPEANIDDPPQGDDGFLGGGHENGQTDFDDFTNTVRIEREMDADDTNNTSYFSERSIERDLHRLLDERDSLQEQADELRRRADELRRQASEHQ